MEYEDHYAMLLLLERLSVETISRHACSLAGRRVLERRLLPSMLKLDDGDRSPAAGCFGEAFASLLKYRKAGESSLHDPYPRC